MPIRLDGDNATATPGITGGDADTGLVFGTDEVSVVTGGTEQAKVDSSGRLLVGTSSTSSISSLVVEGASGGINHGIIYLARDNAPPSSTSLLGQFHFSDNGHTPAAAIECRRDSGTWTSGSSQPTSLLFSTTADGASSPTERMRINSSGRVSIGTTGSTAKLSIWENASTNEPVRINDTNNTNGHTHRISFRTGDVEAGKITSNRTSTNYVTTSDYRLKENVVDIADGIARVKQLQPNRFNFIADPNKTVDGFLAHEVQPIVPEAIIGTHDEVDNEGNPIYQGIDQSKLVPLLTAALQEAIAKIETLEAKVAALEANP